MQQRGLAFVGRGIDEILRAGLGRRIPRIGAGLDPPGCGGDDPEAGIRQRLLDLFVFGVSRIQVLQHFAGRLLIHMRAQHQRFGQCTVNSSDRDRTVGFLQIRQRRGKHAQSGQCGAQGDLGRVRKGLVEVGIINHRSEQLHDIRPALGAVVDDHGEPTGGTPAGAALGDTGHHVIGLGKLLRPARRSQRSGIREVEIVRSGGTKTQVQPGVVQEAQGVIGQFHLPLQHTSRGRRARGGFQHPDGLVAGSGQPGPGVALVMGDAGQRGETRPGGSQVRRTFTLVNRDAQGTAAGGKSTDDVSVYLAIYPRRDGEAATMPMSSRSTPPLSPAPTPAIGRSA